MIIIEIEKNQNVDQECCVVYSESGPVASAMFLEGLLTPGGVAPAAAGMGSARNRTD